MKALKLVEDIKLKKVGAVRSYFRYITMTREEQELFLELMEINGMKIF